MWIRSTYKRSQVWLPPVGINKHSLRAQFAKWWAYGSMRDPVTGGNGYGRESWRAKPDFHRYSWPWTPCAPVHLCTQMYPLHAHTRTHAYTHIKNSLDFWQYFKKLSQSISFMVIMMMSNYTQTLEETVPIILHCRPGHV